MLELDPPYITTVFPDACPHAFSIYNGIRNHLVLLIRVTRSGDFSPKNSTNLGYFPANLQKFWAIFRQIAEM